MNIPEYKTIAGLRLPDVKVGENEWQICVDSTNEDEVHAYARLLEAEGFVRHAAREIPGGSARPYNVNLYYMYKNEEIYVSMSFSAALRTVQICRGPVRFIGPGEERIETVRRVVPSVTQCRLDKSGMCYAVQTEDGKFILIDGGLYSEADAERLYAFLCEKTPSDQKPEVSMWVFTHPDVDHLELATAFLSTYHEKVDISAFVYQFPNMETVHFMYQDNEEIKGDMEALQKNIKTYYPKAAIYTPHTGAVYRLSGAEMEFLWTGEMSYPCMYLTANDFSLALRFRFSGGRTALIFGDAMQPALRRMSATYGDYLKSDVLQVTHHGLIGGERTTYELIDPGICLWATSEKRFSGVLEGQTYQWCIGEGGCDYNRWIRDDSVRPRQHYAQGESTTVLMD